MAVTIGQAIFGEHQRGHSLLAASPAAAIAAQFSGRMDLQGTVPPNTPWKPYFSGFAHGDHYVLARTALDPNAPRAGMVFSRALVLPLNDFAEVAAISDLFAYLEGKDRSTDEVGDFEWKPSTSIPAANLGLAVAMTSEGSDPVVWPQEAGFAEAVSGLWANLWPAVRKRFSFRLAFSPQDVLANPPSLVSTPSTLLSRWSGYRIAQAVETAPSNSAAFLVGDRQARPMRQLMADLSADMQHIADLDHLDDVRRVIDGDDALDDLLGSLRAISYLSPDRSLGRRIKQTLIDRTAERIVGAEPNEIRMARNLDLNAFSTEHEFWKAIESWTRSELWESDGAAASQILNEGYNATGPIEPWKRAVTEGAEAALKAASVATIDGLWRLLAADPRLMSVLFVPSKASAKLESRLVGHVPKALESKVGRVLMDAALAINRPRIHAASAAASFSPEESVALHLDEALYDEETLGIAIDRASPKARIAIALSHDEPALFTFAGEAAANDPKLLASIAVENPRWRAIWGDAITRNPDAWQGPKNPRASAQVVFATLADGDASQLPLVRAIASTPLADLSEHPQRGQIWASLPSDLRNDFLERTADAWITELVNSGKDERVEDELAEAILEPQRLDPLLTMLQSPVRGAMLFRVLPQLGEPAFLEWLNSLLRRMSALPVDAAESIGRLISNRNWAIAARMLADSMFYYGRSDLRPALEICSSLIGLWYRFLLGLGNEPPMATRWRLLEEVAIELYPSGPDENELWDRAGGKRGSLPKRGTGGQIWRAIVQGAERGRSDFDIAKLLKAMSEDFSDNAVLQKMRRDSLFGGTG
jgi:hypothetical protein